MSLYLNYTIVLVEIKPCDLKGSVLIEHLVAARRRRPVRPSATQERNFVGLLETKKILFSLASRPGCGINPMKNSLLGDYVFKGAEKHIQVKLEMQNE